MASWLPFTLPSSIQKRFLSYALSKIGVFDEAALNLDNLNITFGRQNIIELKNVALDAIAISKKAALPPNIVIKTGKVRVLRLTIPADIHRSGIVVDAEGVDIALLYKEETDEQEDIKKNVGNIQGQSPAHRKTARPIPSPEARRARGRHNDEAMPTVQDLARSFLLDEPVEERRQLEASVAAHAAVLDDSEISENSQGTESGTGTELGVPTFLASFLSGIVDRIVVNMKDLCVIITAQSASTASESIALTFRLCVNETRVWSTAAQERTSGEVSHTSTRAIKLIGIRLDLLDDVTSTQAADQSSSISSNSLIDRQIASGGDETVPDADTLLAQSLTLQTFAPPLERDTAEVSHDQYSLSGRGSPASSRHYDVHTSYASLRTADNDRFADAHDNDFSSRLADSQFDIRPGDDNISWGSRRERDGPSSQDLWESTAADDDLPDSLLFDTKHITLTRLGNLPRPSLPDDGTPRLLPQTDSALSRPSVSHSAQGQSSLGAQTGSGSRSKSACSHTSNSQASTDTQSEQSMLSAIDTQSPVVEPWSGPAPAVFADTNEQETEASTALSHAEAESMYMSAMTPHIETNLDQSELNMPGAWGHVSHAPPAQTPAATQVMSDAIPAQAGHTSGHATPRAKTPTAPAEELSTVEQGPDRRAKTLTFIEEIDVLLKPTEQSSQELDRTRTADLRDATAASVFSDRSLPRHESSMSVFMDNADDITTTTTSKATQSMFDIDIDVSSIHVQLDLFVLQQLTRASRMLRRPVSPPGKANDAHKSGTSSSNTQCKLQSFRLDLVQEIKATTSQAIEHSSTKLFAISVADSSVQHSTTGSRLQLRQLQVHIGSTQILSFDSEAHTTSSLRRSDLDISYSTSRLDVNHRVVPELTVNGQILKIHLDLPAITQISERIGGLSGILEIGSSLLSNSASSQPSPRTKKQQSAGVRFQDDSLPSSDEVSMKGNARFAGLTIELVGNTCSVAARTSSIKAIYREQGVSLSTQVIDIGESLPALRGLHYYLKIENTRLDFCNTPSDKDLEKFLALLTPSNDKYDNDDDILLDTLIRQRRKGACLRVLVDQAQAHVDDWQELARLCSLSSDLAQLSVVAQYLPEDDRPGVLTMLRLKECQAVLPVSKKFGSASVRMKELQCAHIGLPSLIATALSDLTISDQAGHQLIHQLLPLSGLDNLPMVMMRMLGDDYEPSIKLKLYNLCAEYSVQTLQSLTDHQQAGNAEHILSDLTQSIADLALSGEIMVQKDSSKSDKQTQLEVLIHNSAIGLNPEKLASKALFVLTDSKTSMKVPIHDTTNISLELRRAALFVIDDASNTNVRNDRLRAGMNTTTDTRLATTLTKMGYASMASIMSARIDLRISGDNAAKKITEIDIRNELVLLETCADSTQTLIATLSALSPPAPPEKLPKYLTEPMSLEHMMSSFTGEAVAAPSEGVDTLFDFNDEPQSVQDTSEDSQLEIAGDDLLLESEMTSSLYGPVSGLIGELADDDAQSDRPNAEAEESLLEEDPFVMTTTPDDLPFSDSTLMKDLREQGSSVGATISLDLLEINDLGRDALGPSQHVLGDHRCFNAPLSKARKLKEDSSRCPVKVRMRDVHFIWNLHDGFDWQKTRDGITSAVEQVEQRTEERLARRRQSRNSTEDDESVIGDFLFNSIYIGVPSAQDAQDIRRQINRHIDDLASETESAAYSGMSRPTAYSTSGRPLPRARRRLKLERSRSHKIAFELQGLSVDFLLYPPDNELQSSVDVRLRHFEIFDNVPTSTWKKFLTLLHMPGGREMSRPMVHLRLLNVKTLQDYAATEMMVHVSLLPLRLHVDQDALDFITRFFEFKDDGKAKSEPTDQPFLQRVEVDTVDLQLDYKPKKVNYAGLRSGHTTEFMNFIILEAANIRLNHAIVYGIKGFEPLHKTLNDVWMPDVRRHQLPTVLAGLAPVRSLVNIGSGVRDVVTIPIREYQKDGRVVRSIQKGAYQFGKTTASELARFGAKVAIGTQNILSGAEELLAPASASPGGRPSPSHRVSSDYGWHEVEEEDDREHRVISAYADQPLGVLAGLKSARRYLEHDLLTAKDALIAVQGEVMNSNSAGSAAVAVARHAPTVILRPMIGATRAVGTALLGVGNQIDSDHLKKMDDKYKRH